jgi:phosphatidylserine/phosphatidylglycerophosphate/cardiolipin synthase-like enzyme
MRPASQFLSVALLVVSASVAHAVVIPIADIHYNAPTGLSLLNGQLVTVQGTVTLPNGILSAVSVDVTIQDATGAIDVFHAGGIGTYSFALGDSVEVTGTITHFNGLTEISPISSLVHLGPADVQPPPLVKTVLDMNSTYHAGDLEPDENRLIRLDGLTILSGTWPVVPSAGNTTLTVQDATGIGTVFIDRDSPVNGTPQPAPGFAIIGVLRQFDSSSPYTSGYQLVPRFAVDVLGAPVPECTGPGFSSSPVTSAVDDGSATIVWTTDSPASSFVQYGLTPTYTDEAGDATPTTSHSVTLTSLQPRTLYYFRAKSTDLDGTCYSIDRSFVTFPSPGTPGDIAVYFTQSVDHTMSSGTDAAGNVDMKTPFLALINSAAVSLDCALYYFNIPEITDALIAAKNRGVEVRLITGHDNPLAEANRFAAAGGSVIASNFGGNHIAGIMHDKYVIKDLKSPNKDDAYLWTGSWNCFPEAQLEANNTIVFHDYGLAAAYTVEFNQMWGSSTMTPNATLSRMGDRKKDITPHLFQVGGRRVEAWMSPSDDPETRMIQYIQQAQHSQYFCIFSFTSDPLSEAMRVHRDSIPGFVVSGLFDPDQVNSSSEWCKLDGQPSCPPYWSPRADVFQDLSTDHTLLHHKYQILDNGYPGLATVWTGSHNWSNAAKTTNDENTVVIHDATIANLYYQEWSARYRENGGGPTAALLARFDAEVVSLGIEIRWQFGDPARVSTVALERAPGPNGPWSDLSVGANNPGELTVTLDRAAEPGHTYYYRLNVGFSDGTRATFGPIQAGVAPNTVSGLTGTVPNPTPGAVRIDYTVAREEHIRISIVDIAGREVDVLVDKRLTPGRYSALWDGHEGRRRIQAGVYFVRWESAGRAMQRRLVFMP